MQKILQVETPKNPICVYFNQTNNLDHVGKHIIINTCVTAVGWQAGNTRLTSSGRSQTRSEHVPGCYGYPIYYGDEYYFYFMGGHTKASLKGGRSCSLGTHNY